ncbi:MAG: response regulator [Lacunisphaera sp.]
MPPGYRLVRAESANAALLALVEGEFAVLVLDINMPVTNGIELANLIKQRKRTQHIPILFLTAYYQDENTCSRATAWARSTT